MPARRAGQAVVKRKGYPGALPSGRLGAETAGDSASHSFCGVVVFGCFSAVNSFLPKLRYFMPLMHFRRCQARGFGAHMSRGFRVLECVVQVRFSNEILGAQFNFGHSSGASSESPLYKMQLLPIFATSSDIGGFEASPSFRVVFGSPCRLSVGTSKWASSSESQLQLDITTT